METILAYLGCVVKQPFRDRICRLPGVEMSVITTLAHIDGKTAHPFDLIECGPLRDKTEEFFEELVPVSGN